MEKVDFVFLSKITIHRYEILNKNIGKHKKPNIHHTWYLDIFGYYVWSNVGENI